MSNEICLPGDLTEYCCFCATFSLLHSLHPWFLPPGVRSSLLRQSLFIKFICTMLGVFVTDINQHVSSSFAGSHQNHKERGRQKELSHTRWIGHEGKCKHANRIHCQGWRRNSSSLAGRTLTKSGYLNVRTYVQHPTFYPEDSASPKLQFA